MNCKSCGAEISSEMRFCSECGASNEIAEIVEEVVAEKIEKKNTLALSIVSMALAIVAVILPLYMALWCGLSFFGLFAWIYWIATMVVGVIGVVAVVVSAKLSKNVVTEKKPEAIFLKVAKIAKPIGLILSVAAIVLPVICMFIAIGLYVIAFFLYIVMLLANLAMGGF